MKFRKKTMLKCMRYLDFVEQGAGIDGSFTRKDNK